jgi:hypothetical protein
MRFRSRFAVVLLLPLLLAACRPDEPTQEPPESAQESPQEAAVSTEAVAGTYALVAVNDEPLPGAVGAMDECEVQLAEGTLDLSADAEYALDLLARAVCDDEEDDLAQLMDRATSEGPYTVEGFEVRFGPAVTDPDPEAFEDRVSEELTEDDLEDAREDALDEVEEGPELYDAEAFAGRGTLRDSLLTVRLDDGLTTLSFVKE